MNNGNTPEIIVKKRKDLNKKARSEKLKKKLQENISRRKSFNAKISQQRPIKSDQDHILT